MALLERDFSSSSACLIVGATSCGCGAVSAVLDAVELGRRRKTDMTLRFSVLVRLEDVGDGSSSFRLLAGDTTTAGGEDNGDGSCRCNLLRFIVDDVDF